LSETWLPGLTALLITAGSAPLVRRVLLRRRLLDVPNARSSHSAPVARGGGIACALGMATAAVTAQVAGGAVRWDVLGAGLALGLVGFADDRYRLSALPRLGAQVLVGAVLGWSLGGVGGAMAGALLMAVVVNVVNFMDGINGITALTVAVAGLTAVYAGGRYDSPELAILGALTAGSALGFLPWNAPRATLFLGDVGSYLFGALLAGTLMIGVTEGAPVPLLAAPLALYLLDAGVALLRRAARREHLAVAHREHIYQRLVDTFTVPHLAVALAMAVLSAVVVAAWAADVMWFGVLVTLVVGGLYLGSVGLLRGRLRERPPAPGTAR